MGTYYSVATVEQLGEHVTMTVPEAQPPIPEGKRLVSVVDNDAWKIAGDVTDPNEFATMYQAYMEGMYTTFDLYALTPEELAQAPDMGRQYH